MAREPKLMLVVVVAALGVMFISDRIIAPRMGNAVMAGILVVCMLIYLVVSVRRERS